MGGIKKINTKIAKMKLIQLKSKLVTPAIYVQNAQQLVSHDRFKNLFLRLSSLTFLVFTNPAIALVDDRLAGEGTGKALGINDPILGWVIIGVFTTVWAAYYAATKELGGQREEDGLGL